MILATNHQPSTSAKNTTMADYLSRCLRLVDDKEPTRKIDEGGLLTIIGPKIVLGEPGMGKSELIRELGRKLSVQPVTAIRFMLSKNPERFIVTGKPILIDGLDEAMARRDGDAVDMILAQLEAAGAPDFILSCRAREWQSRSVTNLRQIYGADPSIFSLEALTRKEAHAFLVQRYAKADSEHVLGHLDAHGISDLYTNPLTLGLMGHVAEIDAQLPATRAALFERVCTLIWSEHDPDRQDSGLGTITEDQALTAAGAIMAGLLLDGAHAASLLGPAQIQDGDVRLADLQLLPGAEAARTVFSSKLFQSVGPGRAKPIHRVIAEFLGARWLAQQARTRRTQRRLLAQMHGGGGVPASLRGLHAWLAFHSSAMAKSVIEADPFGVLRYGETAYLTSEQADYMLDALQALADADPYFRAQDWDSHTATGLITQNLQAKIDGTIASVESNAHLRSLLIEGLKDTPIAGNLADTLEAVMLSTDRFYHERKAAADALMPHRDSAFWQQAIISLHDQGTEDSTRLALHMIEAIDCDVTNELFVATLFAEMGVTICPLPQIKKRRIHTIRHYGAIVEALPAKKLVAVLNLLSDNASLLEKNDWQSANSLAEIVSSLIVRAIDEKAVLTEDAALLWEWLRLLQDADGFHREEKKQLQVRLDKHEDLRRAIQRHALYVARPGAAFRTSEFDMALRMVGIRGNSKDIACFLERLGELDNKDPLLREQWCDLMQLAFDRSGFDPALRAASYKFQRGDAQLEAFVRKLENPKKPAWQRKHEREAAKREKKKRISYEEHRRFYTANRAALRAGELRPILDPARAYVGMFRNLPSEQFPQDRLSEWLGAELAIDAMAGFEAVLHRIDIPSPQEVAISFIEGKIWNYCIAIMAGLLARQRANRNFTDLTQDIRRTGLLLCYERSICDDKDLQPLMDALEKSVFLNFKDRENFARLWIEPSLAAGRSHISGLYKLANEEQWLVVGATLAASWLMTFPNVPENIEIDLINCLTHSEALHSLATIAATRANTVFQNEERMFVWLAVDVLVRFDMVQSDLVDIGTHHPEFIWHLRDRFQLKRHGAMLPVSIAQAKWIVSQFRTQWPYTILEGGGSGTTNPYDATDFLRAMVSRIANDTCVEASDALQELIRAPVDSYSGTIRHMAAEQRQKRAEENFAPLPPKDLGELLTDGPPSNIEDLKSIVLEELAIAQKILGGDDLDQVRDFWGDAGIPYDENRCRDRLAAIIGPELIRYDVQRITEADMPNTKRADLAFARGALQLPMEVKGQWHLEVWQAATDQLDLKYLVDWRSEQRGIYCVLWFGELPSASGRRLKAPPKGSRRPKSSDELRKMLIESIPETRRSLIDVVVLDLSAGKP
jgi:hypothetical protein